MTSCESKCCREGEWVPGGLTPHVGMPAGLGCLHGSVLYDLHIEELIHWQKRVHRIAPSYLQNTVYSLDWAVEYMGLSLEYLQYLTLFGFRLSFFHTTRTVRTKKQTDCHSSRMANKEREDAQTTEKE